MALQNEKDIYATYKHMIWPICTQPEISEKSAYENEVFHSEFSSQTVEIIYVPDRVLHYCKTFASLRVQNMRTNYSLYRWRE